jgi:hypothetical protein
MMASLISHASGITQSQHDVRRRLVEGGEAANRRLISIAMRAGASDRRLARVHQRTTQPPR